MTTVVVGGVACHSLGYVGDVTWSWRWPGGCWEASWEMAGLARTVASPVLKRGARVTIYEGTYPVWAGILSQPGADMTSFAATGLSREAERYLAIDGSGNPSSNTVTAITQAIADGLPWTYLTGAAPTGVASDRVEYLSGLLDNSATAASKRWGVDAEGLFYCTADSTTPVYDAIPGIGVLGQADDEYATHLYGRYVSAMSGTPPVPSAWGLATATDTAAAAPYGRSAHLVDLTPRGILTGTVATQILTGMLANGRARIGFTDRIELHRYQLLRNGAPVNPAFIKAGEVVRLHGAYAPGQSLTPGMFTDFVIGETTYTAGSQTITLAPVGLAPRTLSDVLAVTAIEESVA